MKGASNPVDLNIHELVREVVTSVRAEIDQNTISLRSEIATDLPTVFGDRVQLQQVLTNVVMNSIEAMREITDRPREILINATEAPERVCIQVHDSGPGLDPDTADRIFEPFFTTKPEGVDWAYQSAVLSLNLMGAACGPHQAPLVRSLNSPFQQGGPPGRNTNRIVDTQNEGDPEFDLRIALQSSHSALSLAESI
jgi:K+-sensing histidine kinase KdpD